MSFCPGRAFHTCRAAYSAISLLTCYRYLDPGSNTLIPGRLIERHAGQRDRPAAGAVLAACSGYDHHRISPQQQVLERPEQIPWTLGCGIHQLVAAVGCVEAQSSMDQSRVASQAWRHRQIGAERPVFRGPEGYQSYLWAEQGCYQGMHVSVNLLNDS